MEDSRLKKFIVNYIGKKYKVKAYSMGHARLIVECNIGEGSNYKEIKR